MKFLLFISLAIFAIQLSMVVAIPDLVDELDPDFELWEIWSYIFHNIF